MLVVTAQLVSNLQSVSVFRGGEPFPEPFATVVRWVEIVNLDAFAVFRVGCIATGFNLISKLYAATLSTVAVVVCVVLYRMSQEVYRAGRVWDGHEIRHSRLIVIGRRLRRRHSAVYGS